MADKDKLERPIYVFSRSAKLRLAAYNGIIVHHTVAPLRLFSRTMFSFFKKKPAPQPESPQPQPEAAAPEDASKGGWFSRFRRSETTPAAPEATSEVKEVAATPETEAPAPVAVETPAPSTAMQEVLDQLPEPEEGKERVIMRFTLSDSGSSLPPLSDEELEAAAMQAGQEYEAAQARAQEEAQAAAEQIWDDEEEAEAETEPAPVAAPAVVQPASDNDDLVLPPETTPKPQWGERKGWFARLKSGLHRTSHNLTSVFSNTQIDDDLYDDLEAALLMADAGVNATLFLLDDLKKRVKAARATDPMQVRELLVDAVADLLKPLEKPLVIGEHTPTVIMVAGVNGAGKTTSIGKLTKHLVHHEQSVLLAAADTFRAAAREQLAVWADRNTVEIVSSAGGDPAALSFDAVAAGRARGKDVVLVDTAGRLPTQLHLMEELKKIRRTIQKADPTSPHEVLLVIDGNTGQNALAQVKAFDEALQLTGLIVTKLDGTAKGGVLCAIARENPVPVYFIGVGERIEDLETFNAREFAQALLG